MSPKKKEDDSIGEGYWWSGKGKKNLYNNNEDVYSIEMVESESEEEDESSSSSSFEDEDEGEGESTSVTSDIPNYEEGDNIPLDIINSNGETVSQIYVETIKGTIKKKQKKAKKSKKRLTADNYYEIYPQDRRSREEIEASIEKNKNYFSKLCSSQNVLRAEGRKAILLAVHLDFANKIEEMP